MANGFKVEVKAQLSPTDERTGHYGHIGGLTDAIGFALDEFVSYELAEGNTNPERLILIVKPVDEL